MKPAKARDLGPFEAAREALRGFALGSGGWSDRNAAVIASATAEAVLQVLLMSYFARDDATVDKAFASTFRGLGTRVDAAYCIGVIDQDLATSLRILANIRNVFAHDITVGLFSHKLILPKLRELGVAVPKNDSEDLNQAFIDCVGVIFSRLYRVALFVWWQAGSLPVLTPPSDADWERVISTELCQLSEIIAPGDTKLLAGFGIKTVADVLSAKHPLLLDSHETEDNDLIVGVYLWVVSELYAPSNE